MSAALHTVAFVLAASFMACSLGFGENFSGGPTPNDSSDSSSATDASADSGGGNVGGDAGADTGSNDVTRGLLVHYRFDEATESFEHFREADGLPNGVVGSILSEEGGAMWLGTHRGLVRFEPVTRRVTSFDRSDGLQGNLFQPRAAARLRQGAFVFGGPGGFNSFRPESLAAPGPAASVALTGVTIAGRASSPWKDASRLMQLRLPARGGGGPPTAAVSAAGASLEEVTRGGRGGCGSQRATTPLRATAAHTCAPRSCTPTSMRAHCRACGRRPT